MSDGIGGTYGWPWEDLGIYPDKPWRGFRGFWRAAFALVAVLLMVAMLTLDFSLVGYLFYLAATQ